MQKICRDYGVLIDAPGDDMTGAALRGTFIIDPAGATFAFLLSTVDSE
jgi:alkyl hydroperoxide reductase subunit AhpC